LDDVTAAFETLPPGVQLPFARTIDKDHGRIEVRECWVTADPAILNHIQAYKAWVGLQSLVKIVSERRLPDRTTRETRYFITSLPPDAHHLLDVRAPTGILKIGCIGCLILRFVRMKTGCAKTMVLKIWPCYATWRSTYSNTKHP
jgi:hypothetical protein